MSARKTDPAARQGEIVDATVRVIARDGLSGASLRTIAREIGYTTGVVMHYFRDKEQLLVAAAEAVFGPFEELLAEASRMDDAFEGLRRMCVLPLPTTRAKQVIPRIYAQVLASAETEPAFAEAFRQRYGAFRDGVQSLLAAGQRSGAFRADFEPAAQCDLLCALVDGLALHAVSEPSRLPPDRVVALVTQELEKLRA
ncbi:TetR/AcrR family transcriptional regulator [Pseudonocardia eucalypti]|uniref:TetR/AcrR family transcriptional regulator n=1 Tax=Pseudonocardia eucalypti TaxID=648755 RepID=A0ABP9PVG7_9PSEU|nr:AcrR family transcriptional regulator [Pseudonocardia eucalypti]